MIDFKVDDRELKKYNSDLKYKRQSQILAVQRGVLNDQAKASRLNIQKEQLPKMFNLRSTWIASSIWVDFAKGNKLQSEVGAKKRWRRNPGKDFIALREQEKGQAINNPEINTISSRSNVFSKRVAPSKRLNKLGNLIRLSGSNDIKTIREKDRQNYKGGFYVKNSRRFKKGIYKFGTKKKTYGKIKGRELQMVKDFSKTRARLKRKPWLSIGVKRAVTLATTARFYRRNFERYTKKSVK